MDLLDGLARAEALLQLVALAQRLGLDGDEGAALAGADVLDLGGHPELAVVFDDVAGTDGIDRNFHGLTGSGRMNGIRPRPQGRGEAGGGLYQRPPVAATGPHRPLPHRPSAACFFLGRSAAMTAWARLM